MSQLDMYKSIRPILAEHIAKDAVRIRGSMRFKDKFTSDGSYDRSTARLAAGGDTQPADSYGETYAATATESNKILLLAAMHADAIHRKAVHSLHMSSFDITGAFLHVKLDKKNSPPPDRHDD
jgi:hypothetical protein